MIPKPLRLDETPVHLGASDEPVIPLPGFGFTPDAFHDYIDSHCKSAPGHLIMVESSPTSWSSWECHPEGDEIVIILAGNGRFIQDIEGKSVVTPVTAGDTIINPKGVWHTADIDEPIRAVYITPCPGTLHKER